MNVHEAAVAARLIADRSIDWVTHRVALALEGADVVEQAAARRLLDPEIDLDGIEPPPVDIIRIKRPLPPTP